MTNQIADSSTTSTENFTVKRRYLTEREVEQVMDTARKVSRHGHRDATMILVTCMCAEPSVDAKIDYRRFARACEPRFSR